VLSGAAPSLDGCGAIQSGARKHGAFFEGGRRQCDMAGILEVDNGMNSSLVRFFTNSASAPVQLRSWTKAMMNKMCFFFPSFLLFFVACKLSFSTV
jgi:hypothetical protein